MERHSPVGVTAVSMLFGAVLYVPLSASRLAHVPWAAVSPDSAARWTGDNQVVRLAYRTGGGEPGWLPTRQWRAEAFEAVERRLASSCSDAN